MKIKELSIRKHYTKSLEVSWSLSGGVQSSFDLFLIENGSVVERVRQSGDIRHCILRTFTEPMKPYSLLLTVRSGQALSTVRTGFFAGKDSPRYQSIIY